jgi:hypothetical protein
MKWTKKVCIPILTCLIVCTDFSCTKLNANVYDQVVSFWRTPDEIAAGVAPAYTGLRQLGPGFFIYPLNEVSTDEVIVPTRGQDWGDGSSWEQLWKHTWDAQNHFFEDGWQFIYSGIAAINGILEIVDQISPVPENISAIHAELKTVRAYYYFQALDLFGNVPIAENNHLPLSALGNQTKADVFKYVEAELKQNIDSLSKEVNPTTYGRATQWFSLALLAKLYLNAEVYTGTSRWQDCMVVCDSILNSNKYSLEPNFFDNFKIENQASHETIFAIPYDDAGGLQFLGIQICTLHYNSNATFGLQTGGANGFSSTEDYYKIFDANDYRRKMFLVGQQYTGETQYVDPVPNPANAQLDRLGNPLIFDPVIDSFSLQGPKLEGAGARCAKWEFNKNTTGGMSNDYQLFRLADVILMKAEVQFRLGDNAGALATINKQYGMVSIRSRANMPDFTAAEVNADGILAERARELSWEGWRRNDMIRLGHFLDARVPEKLVSADYRKLYPIPQEELRKNSFLKQNPGY